MRESKFVKHLSCDKCGSSDGNSLYDDGHCYCSVCHTYKRSQHDDSGVVKKQHIYGETPMKKSMDIPSGAGYNNIVDRGITKYSCEAFEVMSDGHKHYYPYKDGDGNTVSFKVRTVSDKSFSTWGDHKQAQLFGQWKFQKGGKFVTVVEGELDCLAAFQMMGSKYPVVSLGKGASAALKECKEQFEWLDSFENIVLCLDNDKPGKEATAQLCELFGAKCKVFKHLSDCKDACDYLKSGKVSDFTSLWWKAEDYRPESVVTVGDIFDRMMEPPKPGVPWCFEKLTELTYGRRAGELYGFGAGVGVGKTDVFTQQIAYDIGVLGEKVGVIYLEQSVVETAQRVAGKIEKKMFHVPNGSYSQDEYRTAIEQLRDRNQLYMMEHFGAMDWASVKSIIRFFAKAYGIKMIYLDHLTALSANEVDERRALDGIMADMASLAQQDGLIIHFISHLTTPDGKPHEEGGRVMEKHFTGSRAIARWSHYMFGLERNKQAEDKEERQRTTFRILKDRMFGSSTGEMFRLHYNTDNGILTEYVDTL